MPPALGPGVVLGDEALEGGRAPATAADEGGGEPAVVCGADEPPTAEPPDGRGGAEACIDGSEWPPAPLACAPGPIAASCWPPSFLRSPPLPVIDPADGGGCEDEPPPRAWCAGPLPCAAGGPADELPSGPEMNVPAWSPRRSALLPSPER